ncbi:hypothetical protein AHAS_Ahas13G0328900 [Arachis hypogaea]
MLGDEEKDNGEECRRIKSFRDAIKERRNSIVEVEEEERVTHSIEKKKESTREGKTTDLNSNQYNAREKMNQEIRIEKINGIYNFVINDTTLKSLRHHWWKTLVVKFLGGHISLEVLSRRLEAIWGKQESIGVIDIRSGFSL